MSFQTFRFQAMGCPCEILLDTLDPAVGSEQWTIALSEARRIEEKYSRYLKGNIVDQINSSQGRPVTVDDETAALLDYAAHCYTLSGGLFDISTGVLRNGVRPDHVGWDKVTWQRPVLTLPDGFEIDFGGICKEYAADRILERLVQNRQVATLVNLGGDIAVWGERLWSIGIEDTTRPGEVAQTIYVRRGGVATSGTTKRRGHILNPQSGRPVTDAPQSVTVATKTCTEAGFWSTLAVLQGARAENFLKEQALEFWCYRPS